MRPLVGLPGSRLVAIRGVFTDLEDTFTTAGRLTTQAYTAPKRLRDAGMMVGSGDQPAGARRRLA